MQKKTEISGYARFRKQTGLTTVEFAKLTGISARTFYALEHNEQNPTAKTLKQLYDGLKAAGLEDLTFDEMLNKIEKYKSAGPAASRRSYDKKHLKELKKPGSRD